MPLELSTLGSCPVCGISGRVKKFHIPKTAVYQCAGCGLRYLDPCLSPSAMKSLYESDQSLTEMHDFHEGYYEYGDLNSRSRTAEDFRKALRILEGNLKSDTRSLLDVGFGNGFFLAMARQRGWKVAGIDSSASNVEKAREKFELHLLQANLEDYQTKEQFDAVCFWDVLEHLPDPHAVLRKASALLKPSGFLVVGIPNDASLLSCLAEFLYRVSSGRIQKGIEKVYFLEHVAYYNPTTLRLLFKKNGFTQVASFQTHTDLDKYSLPLLDRIMALGILLLGRLFRLENRCVVLFQKNHL